MAGGKFGATMTQASETARQHAQKPALQWTGILTALLLAGGEAYLSRDANQDLKNKSAQSEDSHADAIEANAKAITAGTLGLEALQKDREALEVEFRKAVDALQAVAKAHEDRLNQIRVDLAVEAKLRERREQDWRMTRRGRAEVEADRAASEPIKTKPPAPPSPEVAALQAPKDIGKASAAAVEKMKGYAQPRLVPRVWAKQEAAK